MIGGAALADSWARRSADERTIVAVLATLVVAALAVFAVIVPLAGAAARSRADALRVEALVAAARAHRAADDALARVAPMPIGGHPAAAVARALAAHDLVPLAPPRRDADGSIDVIVSAAPFDALVRALDALARSEDLRVEHAVLTRLADGQSVRAELALRPGVAR